MNILRHKKWHVRTKENVARVRRDEAKAAEEEKQRAERATIAENEDRIRRLKARTAQTDDVFGRQSSAASGSGSKNDIGEGEHVNLFAELEEQERTNFATGNKEYAAEKKKEQDDWESKVGIMKRFAEDTKEYSKESEWWQGIPLVREKIDKLEAKSETMKRKFFTKEEKKAKKEEKKAKKREKRRKKKRKRRHSSSSTGSSSSSSSKELERRQKVEALRRERLSRERHEKMRTQKLFEPAKKEGEEERVAGKSQVEEDRKRKYNSQFNPEFSKY